MAMWKLRGYQSRGKLPVSQLSSKDMTNNTSEREMKCLRCNNPVEGTLAYCSACEKHGYASAAQSGKVLSDEERERLEDIRKSATRFASVFDRDIEFLTDLIERLTEQKPVRGGE